MEDQSTSTLKKLAVMQPTFLPWLGYFDLMDQADVFVFYNDVQFVKQSWQTRNRLNGANGVFYANCPVKKNDLGTQINQVLVDNSKPWRKKLVKTLFYTYQKAEYFKEVHQWMDDFFKVEYETLEEQTVCFINQVNQEIGLQTVVKSSSELDLESEDRIDKLIEICHLNAASKYISTPGASVYLHTEQGEERMRSAGIELSYHSYEPRPYLVTVTTYQAYMSIVDLLYNVGFGNALDHIRKGRKPLATPSEIETA